MRPALSAVPVVERTVAESTFARETSAENLVQPIDLKKKVVSHGRPSGKRA